MKFNTLGKYKKKAPFSLFTFFGARLLTVLCIYVRFEKPNWQKNAVENEITNLRTAEIAYRILPSLKAELCPLKGKEITF